MMSGRPGRRRGQALVELALVLPVLLLLGCGAAAIVQLAKTQLAMESASTAAALVGARGVDAEQACSDMHRELMTVVDDNRGLLRGSLLDPLDGACVGPLPSTSSLRARLGGGSYVLWFGYGAADDSFCRVGGGAAAAGPTDGDIFVAFAYRPDLSWIPLVGGWLSPRLVSSTTDKVEPFRSRDPGQDPTGDEC